MVGRYFCGCCGINKIDHIGTCDRCLSRHNPFDSAQCGVCGDAANTWSVHGFRCGQHFGEREPSDMVYCSNGIIIVASH